MTALAATLQAFFTERLARQKNASPHTVATYRDPQFRFDSSTGH
jgi:integrase/recombinase XerD